MTSYKSWGRFPKVSHRILEPSWISDPIFPNDELSILPYGQGRSYGDVCLNDGGAIISTNRLNRIISFDGSSGVITCEAGVTLADIVDFSVPRGWFLPVSPGTKFVSVGGAIANDIHGKNHHVEGTFGRHVLEFELLRSDGNKLRCSTSENAEYFSATIGGLGLTGLILSASFKLKPIQNPFIDLESIKFRNLDEFFEVSAQSDKDFEYTVAWIDCLATRDSLGRGIFMRGNHSTADPKLLGKARRGIQLTVPIDLPNFALNNLSVRLFNLLYYNKQQSRVVRKSIHYDPFFYPLDSIGEWNRIYGKRGFLQFQCVVPSTGNNAAIRSILETIVKSGRASFLAVLKEFGELPSPGILSFPRKGITLCLDFPYEGQVTENLFAALDSIVYEHQGAIYPAKDALMSAQSYQSYFPRWREFKRFIDPKFSSTFWRRVTCEKS